MHLLNFSHPLDEIDMIRIKEIIQEHQEQAVQVDINYQRFEFHLRDDQPFVEQVRSLLNRVDLSPKEWEEQVILVYLPEKSVITAVLLSEINGRTGHFPKILRMKPAQSFTKNFEVAEIIDLMEVRNDARESRSGS